MSGEREHGAGQTPEQAAITGTGGEGRSDGDRNAGWDGGAGSGRNPAPVGGSSGGHSDRKDAGDGKTRPAPDGDADGGGTHGGDRHGQ